MAFRLVFAYSLLILSFITSPATSSASSPAGTSSVISPATSLTTTPRDHEEEDNDLLSILIFDLIHDDLNLPPLSPAAEMSVAPATEIDLAPALIAPPFSDELTRTLKAIANHSDFNIYSTILGECFSILPPTATFFLPVNSAFFGGIRENASLFVKRHTIDQRLSFTDLLKLNSSSSLPTLMPGEEMKVTSNLIRNYSINHVPVTHRNLYLSSTYAVHGTRGVF